MRNQIFLLISNVPVVQWQLRRCRRASRSRGMLPAGWGSWFLLSARPAALISPGLSVWASHNQETAGRRRDSRCGWGWWWLSKFEQVKSERIRRRNDCRAVFCGCVPGTKPTAILDILCVSKREIQIIHYSCFAASSTPMITRFIAFQSLEVIK